jgi:hypothetical protein
LDSKLEDKRFCTERYLPNNYLPQKSVYIPHISIKI